jgi:2-haloacid dehalogenase
MPKRGRIVTLNAAMPVVKGVVFDLGGVVIDWNPMHLYAKVFEGDATKAANFLATICPPAWNARQDTGYDLMAATAERVALFPEWEREIRAYYGRWIEMIGGPVPGTAALMADLKAAGLRLFALSNWHCETFSRIRFRFQELGLFEKIVLSGEHGRAKPDPALYRIALGTYGIESEHLVFVDDSPGNVEAAAKVGLPSLLFRDAETLRRDLAGLGVNA